MRWLLLGMLFATSGCAAGNHAPFQVYQSPLLQAEYHPSERRNREFDPMTIGDHPQVELPVQLAQTPVQHKPEVVEPTQVAAVKSVPKKALPTLSATRVGGNPRETGRHTHDDNFQPKNALAYVAATFAANGKTIAATSITQLYKDCKSAKQVKHIDAKIGDIVFFHNAFDANGDGRNNDWYTHVGIVTAIENGTATVSGWQSGEVRTFALNTAHPRDIERGGREINSQLRTPSSSDAPFTDYYAGQLFAGFCDIMGEQPNLVVIDGWKP